MSLFKRQVWFMDASHKGFPPQMGVFQNQELPKSCVPPSRNKIPKASVNSEIQSKMGVSKNNGTPKSSIVIGFSIINHPFWGTPIFGNTQIVNSTSWAKGKIKKNKSSPKKPVDNRQVQIQQHIMETTNVDMGIFSYYSFQSKEFCIS